MTGYGSWRPGGGPVHAEGMLAAGLNQYDQTRGIDFLSATASAKYLGWQYGAKLGAGYDLPLSGTVMVTPRASLQVWRMTSDGYSEKGAGAAGLAVGSQGFNAVDSEIGARLQTRLHVADQLLGGDLQAGWVHSYANGPLATPASLGGVGFVGSTARPGTDGARMVTGVTLDRGDGMAVRIEYDGEFRHGYVSNAGMLKIRSEF